MINVYAKNLKRIIILKISCKIKLMIATLKQKKNFKEISIV